MSKTNLLVMAAGIGSRYGGLKQVDPIGPHNEIVIDYSIYDALKAGFDKVVFIIRKEIEDVFRESIGRRIEQKVDTAYVFQELDKLPDGFTVPPERKKPWGTGHAVLCAAKAVDGNFAVINADDFYGPGSFSVLHTHLSTAEDHEKYDYAMVGFVLRNTLSEHGHVARGVCESDKDGYLKSITERTKIQKIGDTVQYTEDEETWTHIRPDTLVSMNMWGFTPGFLVELKKWFPRFLSLHLGEPKAEFFIPTVVNELITEELARVNILPTNEKWFGVTYPQDKKKVKSAIRELIHRGVYPEDLWS